MENSRACTSCYGRIPEVLSPEDPQTESAINVPRRGCLWPVIELSSAFNDKRGGYDEGGDLIVPNRRLDPVRLIGPL